jgi:hypothetical protein
MHLGSPNKQWYNTQHLFHTLWGKDSHFMPISRLSWLHSWETGCSSERQWFWAFDFRLSWWSVALSVLQHARPKCLPAFFPWLSGLSWQISEFSLGLTAPLVSAVSRHHQGIDYCRLRTLRLWMTILVFWQEYPLECTAACGQPTVARGSQWESLPVPLISCVILKKLPYLSYLPYKTG